MPLLCAGLCLLKVPLTEEGQLPLSLGAAAGPLCLWTGKSPRGAHNHAVVGKLGPDGAQPPTHRPMHSPGPAREPAPARVKQQHGGGAGGARG